jgi:hypothetical protein
MHITAAAEVVQAAVAESLHQQILVVQAAWVYNLISVELQLTMRVGVEVTAIVLADWLLVVLVEVAMADIILVVVLLLELQAQPVLEVVVVAVAVALALVALEEVA